MTEVRISFSFCILHPIVWSYLALDPRLAAAAVPGVTVQSAVAAALLPGEADGSELGLLPRVNAGDPGGPQQSPAPLCGQRLQKKAVVHLHSFHIEVLV